MAGFCFMIYTEVSVGLIQETLKMKVVVMMMVAAAAARIIAIGDIQVAVTETVLLHTLASKWGSIATCQLYLVCSRSLRQHSLPSNQARQIHSTAGNAGR